MYKHILVVVDGSVPSEQSLTKATQLAKHDGASLLIAHVLDNRSAPVTSFYNTTLHAELKKDAEELLENCREKAELQGIEDVQTVLRSGNPRSDIPKALASEFGVDLLIAGGSGLNSVERMIIGSVTEASMRRAPCDVLTVKTQNNEYQNILVAVDGSTQSEQALAKAIQIANNNSATLTIAHVIERGNFTTDMAFYPQNYEATAQKNAEQMLQTYKEEAEEHGVENVQIVTRLGNPRVDIPRVLTAKHGIDLLVTAATGRNAVERIFTGSVAEASLHRAPCDVMTVKK
ncbi:universal stress protein [Natribacillus halophilus]|uniref:Nucleotide-binding universal stress protein, UspA family n=1 Tax=Natribacillus halophilus TaxID=549003 RepID=A0A1G8N2E1_9BACI|nr:universal stress protein [Natribacillus halophilus]SDI74323.1 Nucleotide-binding universal stress protein, UspA family [Natribacillus halophilus]